MKRVTAAAAAAAARPVLLVVDDSPVNLGVIVEGLEGQGFEVLVAQDGEEVLQRIEVVVPDLILLDVMMPGVDGFEVCRRLKERAATREVPVIFMTSMAQTKDKLRGFEVGAADYLTKPLDIDEVKARIGVHLQLAALQRQLRVNNAELQREISVRRRAENRLRESHAMLQALLAHREEAREDERKRIARDLHEEVGQTLSGLRMTISTLPIQYGAAMHEQCREMAELIDESIRRMRDIVSALRPTPLNMGIAAGLEWLVQNFIQRSGVVCALHLAVAEPDLTDGQVTAFFRIAQEALANVARHACATRVEVRLANEAGHWLLRVRDNGCGFDPRARREGGFGISGMEEHALMVGGKLTVASFPPLGTTVEVRIPRSD